MFWCSNLNFLSSSPEKNITYASDLFNSSFFMYYLAVRWQISGYYQEDSLIHAYYCIFINFWLKGHWENYRNEFLKTWDRSQTGSQTHRLTEKMKTDEHIKIKILKYQHYLLWILLPQIESICIIH